MELGQRIFTEVSREPRESKEEVYRNSANRLNEVRTKNNSLENI
jgi:hypothetical protein